MNRIVAESIFELFTQVWSVRTMKKTLSGFMFHEKKFRIFFFGRVSPHNLNSYGRGVMHDRVPRYETTLTGTGIQGSKVRTDSRSYEEETCVMWWRHPCWRMMPGLPVPGRRVTWTRKSRERLIYTSFWTWMRSWKWRGVVIPHQRCC